MIIINRSKKKLNWNDIREGRKTAEHHGMSIRQTEVEVRNHLDGANAKERREVYDNFFRKKED